MFYQVYGNEVSKFAWIDFQYKKEKNSSQIVFFWLLVCAGITEPQPIFNIVGLNIQEVDSN